MFGKPHTLFRLLGFEVRVDFSWFILLLLVVWSLGASAFPQSLPGWSQDTYFWMAVAAAIGLFVSIVLHEFSHALVARRHGVPMNGITLFIFGGVAQMDEEPKDPSAEWKMALAGPLMSAALAVLLYGAYRLGPRFWSGPTQTVIGWMAGINALLLVFNLLPAFPLDGGRVLRAVLWRRWGDLGRATHAAARSGRILGLILLVIGALQILGGMGAAGIWWMLIGVFIRYAAGQGEQQVVARTALSGRSVTRFMTADPITVPPELPLQSLVEDYVYRDHHKLFPVTREGQLRGCVTTVDIRRIPRERWAEVQVQHVSQACDEKNSIDVNADAYEALRRMLRQRRSRLVVRDGNRLAGVVSLKDLMSFLSVHLELESERR